MTVSELLHEKRELLTHMALRLSKTLETSAESWLNMQTAVNLWEARQSPSPALEAIKPLPKMRRTEVA